ncbi:glycosyltransferase [Synechococcus sp. PCC 7502]|uniref:glycosyltransferase n=1 Tax=Synechococcus sp. PCC 7502 TaxID=1173263 RepID=UPI00029FA4C4|nr:glycosyltransferase [Synechococcus sp. PCC 7502]AFY72439.1 glycosyltransferase [Synechococcus sp. PCC 7502]
MKLLFISTPVGAFGSGIGGGVELTVQNIAKELIGRSHIVHLAASLGSISTEIPIITIPGEIHSFAQNQSRTDPVSFPDNSVLANLWEYARQVQDSYDLIVNFAYDWLPFYLTPFFRTPIAHFVSMGSLLDNIDRLVHKVSQTHKGTIGVYTKAQAYTFGESVDFEILSSGIDLDLYQFQPISQPQLAWVARIAPEKGLEDAAAVSELLQIPIQVMGKMQDQDYWDQVQTQYPQAQLNYLGFHPTLKLQELLGECAALLMTPKWEEAFGNVAIEALACGVPVIGYARGGIVEIIHHQETGFLVEPDNIESLCSSVKLVSKLHRASCRRQAEREFSLSALGDRFEAWFKRLIK